MRFRFDVGEKEGLRFDVGEKEGLRADVGEKEGLRADFGEKNRWSDAVSSCVSNRVQHYVLL